LQVGQNVKRTTKGTRGILVVASVLVLLIGVLLSVLPEHTERFFAWTIRAPLTAAFLGAAYLSSFFLEFMASRRPLWAEARIAVPAVLVFTVLTLIVSLHHLDLFHLNAPDAVARFITWAWLVIYAVVPLLLVALLVRQLRAPGRDPERAVPLTRGYRALLAAHAVLLIPLGIALLLLPTWVATVWPWPLTPLTARAIGAWCVGLGIAAGQAVRENDGVRVRVASISYVAFGLCQLTALARFRDTFDWSRPAGWIFVVFVVSTVIGGTHGCLQARRHFPGREHQRVRPG
jgi:hypothetical protein